MTRKLKYIPIIGEKYRSWEVIDNKIYKVSTNRSSYWKVRCKCGFEGLRISTHLVEDRTSSCKSCAASELSFENSYLNKIKRRCKSNNFDFNLTIEYLMSLFNGKCSLSGLPIQFGKHWKLKLYDQTASLDRIDNTKGYVIDNVQWVHKDVNFMKGKLTQERFIKLCNNISKNNK